MRFLKRTACGLAVCLWCCGSASAKAPIIIIENGVETSYDRQGIINFANDYRNNPRDLTLQVLGHPFYFDVGGTPCHEACTHLRFISPELGIDQTFTGADTGAVSDAFKDYLKSSDFLAKFMRLINSGPGAQISGTPSSTMDRAVRQGFQNTMFSSIQTNEERRAGVPVGTDPQFSGGFAQFTTGGYGGQVIAFTPGFTLDFGARRDKHLKFAFPLAQVNLEGLKTYQAGLAMQYLYPVRFDDGYTLTLGPGVSYNGTFSMDLPQFCGLLGGAMSVSLQKDWDRFFATAAGYYGRFNNLGGIDTAIQANIYGWGAQTGWRFSRRWVTALQVVGLHERVANYPVTTYETVGVALTYRIFNKFDLTTSVNKMIGLPNQRYIDAGLGSAWFF